jgi:oligoendopeptidase F
MTTTTLPERHELDPQDTWDTAALFATPDDWQAAYEQFTHDSGELMSYSGQLISANGLYAGLELYFALQLRLKHLMMYASLERSVNAQDQVAAARFGQVMGLVSEFQSASAFLVPEILAIGPQVWQPWLAEHAGLAVYGLYLDTLERSRPHVRSAEVEAVLGQALDPLRSANMVHGTLVNADIRFEKASDAAGNHHEVAQGTIGHLLKSRDHQLRQSAWASYAQGHLAFENTMANSLVAGLKTDVFIARARKYQSSLEAALAPNHLPVSVFHTLIDSFRQHLPLWHRYWRVRRELLGLKQLHLADVHCSLATNEPKVPYQQAVDWICQGMQPLGEDYVGRMRAGLTTERWVDAKPNNGKRQGAFSSGAKGAKSYIFMSYHPDLYGLSTLAHEVGHSMHSHLTGIHQPPVYANYTLFVAEVASNFNQALVRKHLFDIAPDAQFRLAIIDEALSNFLRYFFIMPTLARFELATHELVEAGKPLNAKILKGILADLWSEGYGDGLTLDREQAGIIWAQFASHLYSNFYVFQYATGIAGAHALAKGVLDAQPGAVERYLDFLKAGSSQRPLDIMRHAGVDLTTAAPVEAGFAVLESYIAELEALAGGYGR